MRHAAHSGERRGVPSGFRRLPVECPGRFTFPTLFAATVRPVANLVVQQMPDTDTDRRLAELDRLLNDPEVRLDAERVWALLAEIALRIPASRASQAA